MPILDEAGPLQYARGDDHTGATHAQHEGQKFLCERKFISGDAVVRRCLRPVRLDVVSLRSARRAPITPENVPAEGRIHGFPGGSTG